MSDKKRQSELEQTVRNATDAVRSAFATAVPPMRECIFFGAMYIDPRHLAIWYIFPTDADLAEAHRSGLTEDVVQRTRAELTRCGYPAEVIRLIRAMFASQETVDRDAGGDYFRYFK